MLIARSNYASLFTISEDIKRYRNGLVFSLNDNGRLERVFYSGRNYTLIIEFIDHDHEFWVISQFNCSETYSVWRGFPYQKQYSNIKVQISGEEQERMQGYIAEIMTMVKEQEASYN